VSIAAPLLSYLLKVLISQACPLADILGLLMLAGRGRWGRLTGSRLGLAEHLLLPLQVLATTCQD
jgi:hypothetical protein